MKKLIFVLLVTMMFSVNLFAQKTLGFSSVKLVTTSETVPAGKVWKIEGVAGSRVLLYRYYSSNNADFAPAQCYIKINGNDVSVINTLGTGAGNGNGNGGAGYSGFTYAASPTNFPLWLPEGTSLEVSTNVTYISVIEFDVINP